VVWLDVDVADEHGDCPSRPSGGLIPPAYRIDPRAAHHALTVSGPRTAESVLWRRDGQSVWLSPVISVAPRQRSSDTAHHLGDAGGLALCRIAEHSPSRHCGIRARLRITTIRGVCTGPRPAPHVVAGGRDQLRSSVPVASQLGGHAARLRVVCGHSNDELRYRATSSAHLRRQLNRPRREPAATALWV
jgi:hypothetical protein